MLGTEKEKLGSEYVYNQSDLVCIVYFSIKKSRKNGYEVTRLDPGKVSFAV